MERLYGGDPDAVFTEAHVISPYRKNYAKQPKVINVHVIHEHKMKVLALNILSKVV